MAILNTSLTDDEYVRSLHTKRGQSAIIDELCSRIENLLDCDPEASTNDLTCPVCEANLKITRDDSDKFTLEVNE